MSFLIPPEALTTAGPYSLWPPRKLTPLEVVYAEMLLQEELLRSQELLLASLGLKLLGEKNEDKASFSSGFYL